MKTRIIAAICMAAVGIPILIFSQYIIFPIAISILALFAMYEMLRVLSLDKNYLISLPPYILALAFPTLSYFFAGEHIYGFLLFTAGVLFVYLIYLFAVAVFMRGKLPFSKFSEAFTTTSYIVFSFTAISAVRQFTGGLWYVVMLLIIAWGCDIFAYFTGFFIGKHKLIVEISPKKTVEGAVGGIVGATLLVLLYGFIVEKATDLTPNYLVLAITGAVLSTVSQIGDLIASLIKREHGVKDYGSIFPGHGGVMDRFDSVLSITTILIIICILFPPFV